MRCSFVALGVVALGCSSSTRPATLENTFDSDLPGIDATLPIEVYVPPDAIPITPTDVSCGGRAVSLTRRDSNVILVIDRSGSMSDRTSDGMIKWLALREALQAVLPGLSSQIAVGLTFFPSDLDTVDGGTRPGTSSCEVPTTLAFEPRTGQSTAILDRLNHTNPDGSTPTAASLQLVYDWYHRVPDLAGDRYVVLATDGAPNCNAAADIATCRCSVGGAAGDGGTCVAHTPQSCLDQGPVVARLEALAHDNVHTFVIGLNGVQDYAEVLNAMADAGGRGRPGSATHYYSASTAGEITRQLEGISEVVENCTLRVEMPPDPALVDVRLDGRSLYHDVRRVNGWDWGDDAHTQIVFYGQACSDVSNASGGSRLVAAFGCPAPVPP